MCSASNGVVCYSSPTIRLGDESEVNKKTIDKSHILVKSQTVMKNKEVTVGDSFEKIKQ